MPCPVCGCELNSKCGAATANILPTSEKVGDKAWIEVLCTRGAYCDGNHVACSEDEHAVLEWRDDTEE